MCNLEPWSDSTSRLNHDQKIIKYVGRGRTWALLVIFVLGRVFYVVWPPVADLLLKHCLSTGNLILGYSEIR